MLEEHKKIILEHYFDKPKGVVPWLTKNKEAKPLLEALKSEYPQLDKVAEMLYWLANNLIDFPKCPVCGKCIKAFASRHYPKHCSRSCTQHDEEVRNKNKKTCMDRYGVDNSSKSIEIRQKQKQTMLDRYGVTNIFEDVDYIRKKNIEKLGVENCAKIDAVIQKRKKTLIAKYGVNCGFKLSHIPHKSKGELELYNFILERFPTTISGDREIIKPLELDIYTWFKDRYRIWWGILT